MKNLIFFLTISCVSLASANTNLSLFPSGVEILRSENANTFTVGGLVGQKQITGYSPGNKGVGVSKMVVRGRSPKSPRHFEYETALLLVLFVTQGPGHIYINDRPPIIVQSSDVVVLPPKTRFAVESISGAFEYVTFTNPKWYPEQSHVVDSFLNRIPNK